MLSTLKPTLIRSIKMYDIRFRYNEKEKKEKKTKKKKIRVKLMTKFRSFAYQFLLYFLIKSLNRDKVVKN